MLGIIIILVLIVSLSTQSTQGLLITIALLIVYALTRKPKKNKSKYLNIRTIKKVG